MRGLTRRLSVLEHIGRARHADDLYLVVSSSGREYLVDHRERSCECPDFHHRQPAGGCYHLWRVDFATGHRPIPAWVNRKAIDDQLGLHVDRSPRFDGGDGVGGDR